MILTVTLNMAVDVTYGLDHIQWGRTNAVQPVGRRAGGKGVNVARTLQGLGREVMVAGLAGGRTGATARAELSTSGLVDATVEVAGESRTTLVVVEEKGEVTGFSEPGPQVTAEEWARLTATFTRLAGIADVVVLSGSLPPGVPVDAYAQLIAIADRARTPVVLDSHGEALAHGVSSGPAIVAVNADELRGVVSGDDVVGGAAQLLERGASAAVISMGAEGIVAVTDEGAWQAAPPEMLRGNPTGAGDAVSAAMAVGVLNRTPWPARLADAVALSAAAVCAPLAGSFDQAVYRRLLSEVAAEELRWR
jgi:tagatose 6-phosphate kinase